MPFLIPALVQGGIVLLVARLVTRTPGHDAHQPRRIVASGLGLAAFLAVPPGSLPPLVDTAWSGWAAWFCLLIVGLLSGRILPALGLVPGLASVSILAWSHGLPGDPGNLGTYVGQPVWSVASVGETVCLVAAGACALVLGGRMTIPGPDPAIPRLALAAVLAVLFLPWNLAPEVTWPVWPTATADMILFWLKTMAVYEAIGLAARMPDGAAATITIGGLVGTGGLAWLTYVTI